MHALIEESVSLLYDICGNIDYHLFKDLFGLSPHWSTFPHGECMAYHIMKAKSYSIYDLQKILAGPFIFSK